MSRVDVLQQKLEHWCAASVRALANEPSVIYRGHYLHVKERPFPIGVAHLHIDSATSDYRKLRGIADGIALRLSHSDHDLHQQLIPENALQAWIFELLEQLRVESLVSPGLAGSKVNLRRCFLHWATQVSTSGLTENHAGVLVFAVAMTCWSRLSGEQLPEGIDVIIESTRMSFSRLIGVHLQELTRQRQNQLAYSDHALAIAETIQNMIVGLSQHTDDNIDNGNDKDNDKLEALIKTGNASLRLLYADSTLLEQTSNAVMANDIVATEQEVAYKIFTTAYDKELDITRQVRPQLLKKMRSVLDKRLQQQAINIPRLANYIAQLFANPQLAGWSFGEEEGFLDAGRLSRLVTSSTDRRLFRKELAKPRADCVVTVLLDNSGSMTGHSEELAVLVDTLARALELAAIKTEILGFTTGEWNGGKAYKKWLASGRPENPGRLNQLCHTIYKTAKSPWRRSRQAIAGLLKTDLFREGIDGEALQWAVSRISKYQQSRRVIMVVSDGSPMDTTTQLVNTERYLDRHLQQVARDVEESGAVSLCALGIGLDLSAYYRHSLSLDLDKALTTNVFFAIADLLNGA